MRGSLATTSRAAIAQIACVVLLGLFPGALAVQAQGINDHRATAGALTQWHDHTRGTVPGSIGAKRQQFKAGSSARAGQYNYTRVDVPGAVSTSLFAINSKGQTVGLYEDGSGTSHAFLREVDGSIVTIDYPGAIFMAANGINSQGDIVGRWDDANGIRHSFLRTSLGAITSFDPPAPCVASTLNAAAHGINSWGDIVGRCFDASGKELAWFLRHDGSFKILDDPSFVTADGWAINNSRVVVGDYSGTDEFVHGFTWREGDGFTTLDIQDNMTGLRAINQQGDISGIYFDGVTLHGFLRPRYGTEVTIDHPDSVWTDTAVVNNRGTVAGTYWDASSNQHGYIAIRCDPRD